MANRFTSDTPKFFKILRNIAGSVAGAATTVLALSQTGSVEIPQNIKDFCLIAVLIGLSVAGTAQSAKQGE